MADKSQRLSIDIEATNAKAKPVLKETADAVEKLEDAKPVVEIGADGTNAQKGIGAVQADAKELASTKVEVPVTVDEASIAKAKQGFKDTGDAADNMGKDVNAQVGPMRDVAGAMGNTGTAALDATEGILGLGETLENMGGSLGKVGGLLVKGGFFAAIASFATEAAFAAVNAITGANRKIEQSQAEVVASYVGSNEDMVKASQKLVRSQGDLWEMSDLWTDFGETTKFAGDQASRSIEDIDQALDKFKDNPAIMMKLLASMRLATEGLDKNTDAYKENMDIVVKREAELRTQMLATAAQGKADADYAKIQDTLNEAALLGIDITHQSQDAIEKELAAKKEATETTAETVQSIRDQIAAQKDLKQTLKETTDGIFAQNDKMRANRDAWRSYDETLKDINEDGQITEEEMDDLTRAVDDVAASALEVDGNTKDAINALKLMATGNLPPALKAYIDGLISQIEELQRKTDAARITFEKPLKLPPRGSQIAFMGGGPVQGSGSYVVGESGPERVWLPKGAQVDNAFVTAAQGGGGSMAMGPSVTYLTINVNVAPGAQPADIGRVLVSQLQAYERANGRKVLAS